MIKTLKKYGGTSCFTIDKTILGLLQADEDTQFRFTVVGKKLVIEPTEPNEKLLRASELTDEIMETHDEVFRKLAE